MIVISFTIQPFYRRDPTVPNGQQWRPGFQHVACMKTEVGLSGVDLIRLDQDRDKWRAVVNSVMNRRIPQKLGNYRVAVQPVAFRVVLSSTELVS
jgi:hypothetical protein